MISWVFWLTFKKTLQISQSVCDFIIYTFWESIRLYVSHFYMDHYHIWLKWPRARSYNCGNNNFIRFLHLHTIRQCSHPLEGPEIRTTCKTDEESTPITLSMAANYQSISNVKNDTTVCLSKATSQTMMNLFMFARTVLWLITANI